MIKKLLVTVICISLILIAFAGCGGNANNDNSNIYQSVIETARTQIWSLLLNGSNTNASIAIMDNNKIVYSEAFGMRDIDNSIPADTNTQFNIGSVSKVFTAAAVMLLCDQGKVELDKPVTTYLPEFTMQDSRYKDITVRMLLNHTSGLPGTNFKDDSTIGKDGNFLKETISLLAESTLKSNPGEISVYCNDGFTVAQAVIEKVSGRSYGDFLDQNIFSKLNMKNSSAYFKDDNSNVAITFNSNKRVNNPKEYVNPLGAGGVTTTAEDLCRFGTVFYSDAMFFKTKSLEELQKVQYGPKTVPKGIPDKQYGLGWDSVAIDQFQRQNVIVLNKRGATNEYISNFCVAPKEKISIAITLGGSSPLDTVNAKVMQSLLECKGIVKKIEDKKTLPLKVVPMPENISIYNGYYQSKDGILKIDFDIQKNTVNTYKFSDGDFVKNGSFQYKEDGYFYDYSNNKKFIFITNYDTKFIAYYSTDSTKINDLAEGIKVVAGNIQFNNFENKIWIPCNSDCYEITNLCIHMAKTLKLNELPNYMLYKFDANYYVSQLVDKNTAKMTLRFIRDLYEPKIVTDNGLEVLKLGNYKFVDASKLGTLKANTKVVIGEKGFNESRIVDKDAVFKCKVGDKCRIVVFSCDGTSSYDSLYDGAKEIVINKGSYVSFIGDAGTTFEPEITQYKK